jgi:hypothetical protein
MGNVTADGKQIWLSGRWDNVVYAIDTSTGAMRIIPVGIEPHGFTVWPQPGRYSLGHTGNMRYPEVLIERHAVWARTAGGAQKVSNRSLFPSL